MDRCRRTGDRHSRRLRENGNEFLAQTFGKASGLCVARDGKRQHRESCPWSTRWKPGDRSDNQYRRSRNPPKAGTFSGDGRCLSAQHHHRNVRPLRQLDRNRIFPTSSFVVLPQLSAETRRLYPDNRVDAWVVRCRTVIDIERNRIFLNLVALSRKRLLHDESKKAPLAFRAAKSLARQNSFELQEHRIPFGG